MDAVVPNGTNLAATTSMLQASVNACYRDPRLIESLYQ